MAITEMMCYFDANSRGLLLGTAATGTTLAGISTTHCKHSHAIAGRLSDADQCRACPRHHAHHVHNVPVQHVRKPHLLAFLPGNLDLEVTEVVADVDHALRGDRHVLGPLPQQHQAPVSGMEAIWIFFCVFSF